jgi:autotransporter-associated beta strand protein
MKAIAFNRFSAVLATSGLLFSGALYSQTVEINPAGAIPAAFTLAQAWEWDSPGNLESWTANAGLTLEDGTPTDDGGGNGSVKGTAATTDPTFTSPITTIATPYRVIIEMRIKKESTDETRMDLFWDDLVGGFAAARVFAIPASTLDPDDSFKTVRITFPYGRISGQLDRLRFDPIADEAGIGKTMALDYLRVYTETRDSLEWDTDTFTPNAQGGSGTWEQLTTNNWWDGAANTTWPASDTFAANFGGSAGTVTVAGGGVNASILHFTTPGYVVEGGPIHLGTESAVMVTPAEAGAPATVATRINSAFTGTAPLRFRTSGNNGAFVLSGSSPSYSGALTLAATSLGIVTDDALGTGTVTFGVGGNAFINALDGNRTIANNVIFAGNRMLIDNTDLGTGLTVGNLTLNGNLALNCISPGDLYLRKNLTVNGVVSGSNSNIGLLLAGNAGTLTLTGANTFTGNVKWANNSVIEVNADSALGDPANTLNFNAGSGALRLLASFDCARAINVNGDTSGRIVTNGFDSVWSGNITGTTTAGINSRFFKQGAGKLTLTGTSTLGGGTQVQEGTLEIPAGASLTHGAVWDNSHGVGGGATFLLNGGTFTINNSFYGVGNGSGTASEALFQMNSGAYNHLGGSVLVGFRSSGRWVMNGGNATINQLGYGDGDALRTAIVELNGGTLTMDTAARRTGDSAATIKLNGTTIVAKSNKPNFLPIGSAGTTEFLVGSGGAIFDTDAFNIGIVSPLEHDPALGGTLDGGLTKHGSGILTLNAANTYTGDTTVNGGTLVVTGESIADTGKLVINSGAIVELTANETVNSLFYGTSERASGTYGSSSSTATFKDNSRFAGTGVLTVLSGEAATGYAGWAAIHAGGQTADLDFDNDGVSNGVEYFMGETGSTFTPNPSVVAGTITWPKDPGFLGTFKVQISDTLAIGGWTDIVPPNASINETNPDQIIFTLPAGDPRKFVRLSVTPAP